MTSALLHQRTTRLFLSTHFISKARQGNILLTISKNILNSALRNAGYTKKIMCEVIHYPPFKILLNILYPATVGQNGCAKGFSQTVALLSAVTVHVINSPAFKPQGKFQLEF